MERLESAGELVVTGERVAQPSAGVGRCIRVDRAVGLRDLACGARLRVLLRSLQVGDELLAELLSARAIRRQPSNSPADASEITDTRCA